MIVPHRRIYRMACQSIGSVLQLSPPKLAAYLLVSLEFDHEQRHPIKLGDRSYCQSGPIWLHSLCMLQFDTRTSTNSKTGPCLLTIALYSLM